MSENIYPPSANKFVLSTRELNEEMRLPHEGYPHGVPHDYSWYTATIYRDLNFPTTVYPPVSSEPHTWNAYAPWGQVYEAEEGNPATNTRVAIKDIQAYYLSSTDNQWHQAIYEMTPVGGFYREDFQGDDAIVGSVRNEPDGSISVIPGGGRVYHFFPSLRVIVNNPDDIEVIYGTFQARLIPEHPNGTDDRSSARFVANAGLDLWYDESVGWDHFLTNTDSGVSRFRYVTNDYQYFSVYSAKAGIDMTTVPAPPTAAGNPG